jgi:hypothetical protein
VTRGLCRQGRRRAAILILTLWIVLVLTLLAHSLAFEIQVESKLTSTYRDQFRAEQMARIGIARAVTDLRNDRLSERPEETIKDVTDREPFDALGDIWTGASIVPRVFEVENADAASRAQKIEGEYELFVLDEESKIGLNNNKEGMHLVLKFLLMQLDLDETDAEEIAYAIRDWKDADDDVAAPEGTGGANGSITPRCATSSGGAVVAATPRPSAISLKRKTFSTPRTPLQHHGRTHENPRHHRGTLLWLQSGRKSGTGLLPRAFARQETQGQTGGLARSGHGAQSGFERQYGFVRVPGGGLWGGGGRAGTGLRFGRDADKVPAGRQGREY